MFRAAVCVLICVSAGCGERGIPGSARDAAHEDAAADAQWDAAPDHADAFTPVEIEDELAAIPTMTVREIPTGLPGYRCFELSMSQPVDHDDPGGRTFRQHMTLLHRSADAPMVLVTAGYWNYWLDYPMEPTWLFQTNQLVVEHRFFGESIPDQPEWELMTIRQAAADLHRVVEAIRPLYGSPWISTGASKGGMTAVFFRRFHPEDVDGTVAYVAPISFGAPDARYITFLEGVGDASCRASLRSLQVEALDRRQEMLQRLSILATQQGLFFDEIGGQEAALEATVLELPFTFWQYHGTTSCGLVPPITGSDDEIFSFLDGHVGFDQSSDEVLEMFAPYYFQAQTQLGYPDIDKTHLQASMTTDGTTLEQGLLPSGAKALFDPEAMVDIASWVESQGDRLMFVYGENDPWTAGAYSLGNASDSYLFVVPHGTHSAVIEDLAPSNRLEAIDVLQGWLGATAARRIGPSYPGHLLARNRVRR